MWPTLRTSRPLDALSYVLPSKSSQNSPGSPRRYPTFNYKLRYETADRNFQGTDCSGVYLFDACMHRLSPADRFRHGAGWSDCIIHVVRLYARADLPDAVFRVKPLAEERPCLTALKSVFQTESSLLLNPLVRLTS